MEFPVLEFLHVIALINEANVKKFYNDVVI